MITFARVLKIYFAKTIYNAIFMWVIKISSHFSFGEKLGFKKKLYIIKHLQIISVLI